MEGWKPLATLAREADVPEASARRYAETFSTFFRSRRVGKAMLYDPEAVDVLRAVSNAFGDGRRRPEVQELLAARFGQLHEVEPVRDDVVATRQEPTAPTSSADLAPTIQAFTVAVDRLASAMLADRIDLLEAKPTTEPQTPKSRKSRGKFDEAFLLAAIADRIERDGEDFVVAELHRDLVEQGVELHSQASNFWTFYDKHRADVAAILDQRRADRGEG